MIPNRPRRLAVWCLVLPWLVLDAPCHATTPDASSPVATWRDGGRLERAEYLDWLLAKGLDDRPDAIRELIFVRTMAEVTRTRIEAGADGTDARRIDLEVEARRHRLLLPVLKRHLVSTAAPISDAEIDAFLRDRPDAFARPLKVRLRNLYKALGNAEQAPAVRAAMDALHRQLLDGADFDALARAESESQTRFRGGRMGLVEPDDLPPTLAAAVRALRPGEITPPLEHAGGLTLFLCEAIRPAQVPSATEARSKARESLERHRAKTLWNDEQKRLADSARIDLDAVPHLAEGGEARRSDRPILVLGDHRLDRDDLQRVVAIRRPSHRATDLDATALDTLLRSWAVGVAGAARAVELGLDRRPDIAARSRWLPIETLARRELVRRIDGRLTEPDDATLRQRFERRRKRYREPQSVELAAIRFAEDVAVDTAIGIAARVDRGELAFDVAASRHSVLPSAAVGGYLGWRSVPALVDWGPTAVRAIRALSADESSELLHLESGLWIFRLLDRRDARPSTFEEARPRLRDEHRAEQIRDAEQAVRMEVLEALAIRSTSSPQPDAEPVVVRWSTASELDVFGYDVYRAEAEEGPFVRLTEEALPGGGTTDLTRDYRFEDPAVEVGATYYYYVESISVHGARKRLTPIRAVTARRAEAAGDG